METIEQLMNALGDEIVADIKRDIMTKQATKYGAVNASGKLHDSIRREYKNGKLSIYGEDYAYFVENGRKPGKMPPKKPIEDWVRAKGLFSDISEKSLVYLIRRKIAQEGTEAYKQGGTGLFSDIANDELKNVIREKLRAFFLTAVLSNFDLKIAKVR